MTFHCFASIERVDNEEDDNRCGEPDSGELNLCLFEWDH
jgi:hypothetical protein